MSNTTVLPKRNLLIRFLYFVLVVVMFSFALILMRGYWNLMINNQQQPAFTEPANAAVHPANNDQPAMLVITGLKKVITLDGEVENQVIDLWAGLYANDVYKKMPKETDLSQVYMAYYNYSEQQNTVDVLLGYQADIKEDDGSGLIKRYINTENHQLVENKTVLDVWLKPEKRQLNYDNDFDIYTLDASWNVVKTKAMVSIYQGVL